MDRRTPVIVNRRGKTHATDAGVVSLFRHF